LEYYETLTVLEENILNINFYKFRKYFSKYHNGILGDHLDQKKITVEK